MIVHAFKSGTELLAAIDGSFELDAVMGAIKTYSRKNESVEALLLAEYEAFGKDRRLVLEVEVGGNACQDEASERVCKDFRGYQEKFGYMPHRAAQMQGYFARTHHAQGHVRTRMSASSSESWGPVYA